eukprot:TRINITY_DN6217_c0_g1_i1.p1 TRINITY_DN6217_c0_g1~~TRINITY_DN6217_c0_g1_i1.p1  ORF type:complete len:349 (-),score=52.01 TRINITY_DN6217_c0_g1_i1:110-1156(-)
MISPRSRDASLNASSARGRLRVPLVCLVVLIALCYVLFKLNSEDFTRTTSADEKVRSLLEGTGVRRSFALDRMNRHLAKQDETISADSNRVTDDHYRGDGDGDRSRSIHVSDRHKAAVEVIKVAQLDDKRSTPSDGDVLPPRVIRKLRLVDPPRTQDDDIVFTMKNPVERLRRNITIDNLFYLHLKHSQMKDRPLSMELREVRIGDLRCSVHGIGALPRDFVHPRDTPVAQFLQGKPDRYLEYVKVFSGKNVGELHDQNHLLKLFHSIQENGYDPRFPIVVHRTHKYPEPAMHVVDGQHRASVLWFLYGSDAKILVLCYKDCDYALQSDPPKRVVATWKSPDGDGGDQ